MKLATLTVIVTLLCLAPWLAVAKVTPGDSPDLLLKTLDGKQVRLSELRGRVVLLDFWATWCPPCRQSFPVYAELASRYRDRGLTVVAVSVDEHENAVRAHIKDHPVPFVVAVDAEHRAVQEFEPEGMPTAYLIDKNGVVREVHEGFEPRDGEKLEKQIEKLLRE